MSLEKILEYRNNFKDLKYHEIRKSYGGTVTTEIRRGETHINFQPPYSLDEVNSFEYKNNIQLPEELKIYLTKVSRSVYKNHLEFRIIELNDNENFKKQCPLEGNYRLLCAQPFCLCPQCESDDEDKCDEFYDNDPLLNFHGMMTIREVGCGYTDQIVLNGKFKGTIWHEKFAGDGGIMKTYDSFFDYILEIPGDGGVGRTASFSSCV